MSAPETRETAATRAGSRSFGRRGVIRTAGILGALAALATRSAADSAQDAALREQRAAFKRIEAALVIEPARREWSERRERARAWRRRGFRGARLAPADTLARLRVRSGPALAVPRNPGALAINVRMNPAPGTWTQSEVSVAKIGNTLVAAWNDGTVPSVTGFLAYGYSRDGGRTWRGGIPWPLASGVVGWESDPVVVADPRRGEFWMTALAVASQPPSNALGVVRGAVSDTGIVWSEISVPRVVRDTLPDKPWLAVDSLTGRAMLSYTSFFRVGQPLRDQIEFQHSDDGGHTWSPPLKLSSDSELGLVQGSRPAVGPDGEVHVVWGSIDTTSAFDSMRLRSSRDGGESFAPAVDVARVISNFASGAPGFNRPYGINFPSIAVDRSDGPHRGRIYVAWTDAADFYNQPLSTVGSVLEPTDSSPREFVVGDMLRGTYDPQQPSDRFRFAGRRGETAMFYLDSLASQLDVSLAVGCGDNSYELAFSDPPGFGRGRIAVVTLPRDGEFTLTVGRGRGGNGPYRVRTGWLVLNDGRGRDARDVFAAYSDDGRIWSEPARVSDAPPWFDDWLPEVAVGSNGDAYVAWYDWRNTPASGCGMLSNVSLSRSTDGGGSWRWLGLLSDRPNDWSTVESNLVPNQGDYIGLFADSVVCAGWADGRNGTPDAYFARFDPASLPTDRATPATVALSALRPNPASGAVSVTYAATPGLPARLELWDVGGRRLQDQVIDVPTSSGEVRFAPRPGLKAGVYLVRLVQGRASATARLAIVP